MCRQKSSGGVDGGGVAGEGEITELCVMVVVVMEEEGKEQWQCGCGGGGGGRGKTEMW